MSGRCAWKGFMRCKTCHEDGEFYPYNQTTCKKCLRMRNRAWVKANRNKHIDYQKKYQKSEGRSLRLTRFEWLDSVKNVPCMDCKQRFPPECMDFDHRDPLHKKMEVSRMAVSGYALEKVKAEVAKCDIICANCHRIRTAKQQNRRNRNGI